MPGLLKPMHQTEPGPIRSDYQAVIGYYHVQGLAGGVPTHRGKNAMPIEAPVKNVHAW